METKVKSEQEIATAMKAAQERLTKLRAREIELKGVVEKIQTGLKDEEFATSIEGAEAQQNLLLAHAELEQVREQLRFDAFLHECKNVKTESSWNHVLQRSADPEEGFRICTVCALKRRKETELLGLRKIGQSADLVVEIERLVGELTVTDGKHRLETGITVPCRELLALGIPLTVRSDGKFPEWVIEKFVLEGKKTNGTKFAVYFQDAQYGLGHVKNDGRVHAIYAALTAALKKNPQEKIEVPQATSTPKEPPQESTLHPVKEALLPLGEAVSIELAAFYQTMEKPPVYIDNRLVTAVKAAWRESDGELVGQEFLQQMHLDPDYWKEMQKRGFIKEFHGSSSAKTSPADNKTGAKVAAKQLSSKNTTPHHPPKPVFQGDEMAIAFQESGLIEPPPSKPEPDEDTKFRKDMRLPDWMEPLRFDPNFDRKKDLKLLRNNVGDKKPESMADIISHGIAEALAQKTAQALGLPATNPVAEKEVMESSSELNSTPASTEETSVEAAAK